MHSFNLFKSKFGGFEVQVSAMALTPPVEVRAAWESVEDAARWAGVKQELWTSVATLLGDPELTNLMLLAGVSDEDYRAAVSKVVPEVSPLQKSSLNLLFNGVKAAMGVPTLIMQALASPPAVPSEGGSAQRALVAVGPDPGPVFSSAPRIKLSQVIDQARDIEVPLLDADTLNALRMNYVVTFGDNPMDNAEVSDAQLTALQYVVVNGFPPFTDFGVWGPFGMRTERRMKFKSRTLDAAGSWILHEVPGPDSIESWRKCWKVFAAAATMTKVATAATLQRYESQFEDRCERHHRSWHLCVQADIRCRSEWMVAERRRQEAFFTKHPTISAFNPRVPWDSVLRDAADSQNFWYKELLEPALLYERASGAVSMPIHRALLDATEAPAAPPTRKYKRGKTSTKGGKGSAKGAKGEKKEFCFAFNRSENGCSEPCPHGRMHSCQGCNAPGVRAINCCHKDGPPNKKGKTGGKGRQL